jgi:hypothetical protein
MEKNREYTPTELTGIAAMLSDMLKEEDIFNQQAKDMRTIHPWLAETIGTIENPHYYASLFDLGGGKAEFDSSSGIVHITLPAECVTDGEQSLWGDTLPVEFYFSKTASDKYIFTRSLSNEERAAVRNS